MFTDPPTARLHMNMLRVVIVHDDLRACLRLADALATSFVVRLALGVELTCVVGVLSTSLRARDVHARFIAAGGKAERIVFVTKQDLAQSLEVLDETIEVVRRLGDRRFY
jgi:hypothetical protein